MYHFFVEPEQIQDKEIIITGSDVNHIKNVIRLKVGDEISISNGIIKDVARYHSPTMRILPYRKYKLPHRPRASR